MYQQRVYYRRVFGRIALVVRKTGIQELLQEDSTSISNHCATFRMPFLSSDNKSGHRISDGNHTEGVGSLKNVVAILYFPLHLVYLVFGQTIHERLSKEVVNLVIIAII